MSPYRKPFFGDPLFPFDIVHKDKKSPQTELPDHLHDRYELVYVYRGKGTFFIDNTFYDKRPGDLFLIPGNTIHRSTPELDDPIVSTALFFAPAMLQASSFDESYNGLLCFDNARKRKGYKLELPPELCALTEQALEQIHIEQQLQKMGYRQAIRIQLQLLLLQLNRHTATNLPSDPNGSSIGPPWLQEALRAIDEHSHRGISLTDLAERVAVTPAHFSRVFKQLTGMNVTDYVNAKRIVHAKEMLNDTNENIGRIADHCGFESLPHFHRVFKSLTGMTPGAYKKSANKRS